jgi:hypothetical protein
MIDAVIHSSSVRLTEKKRKTMNELYIKLLNCSYKNCFSAFE